nr:hypothetical protein [Tanacetum cinerariifolium]
QDHLQSDAATRGDTPESLTLQLVPLMPYCGHPPPLSISKPGLKVSTKLQSTLQAIVGPSCLAAAATELSLTSHLGLGVVSSSLFRGGVSASGISSLRLVDGTGRCISNNSGIPDGSSE